MKYFFKKLKHVVPILVLFLTTVDLPAQLFNVIYLDTTSFPTMKAGFIAKKSSTVDYTGLTNNDFKIWENGINYAPMAKVECKATKAFPPVSVALVCDVSGSMDEDAGNGEKRLVWVKDGAKAFLDSVRLDAPSSGCVITFATTVTSNSGWRSDNAYLKNFIDYIKVASGNTDFLAPFEDWKEPLIGTYESFKKTNPNIRRVVVFLSDGDPQKPFLDAQGDQIIKHCKEQKVEVYAIMITSPANMQLERICNATGGKIFTVWSKDALLEKYREIVGAIQSQNVCELVWQAPMNCDLTNMKRDLNIVFNPIPDSVKATYNVPAGAIAKLEVSDNQLLFGAPSVGITKRQLTITAKNSDFTITKETLTPNKDFKVTWSKTLPFVLKKDAKETITIDYTEAPPTASHEVLLTIEATPCPSNPVSLIAPCGGEVVATSSLGDVAVSSSSNKTITCAFKNTTFVALTGEAKLSGTNASEFTIVTGGGNFTLNPGQCLDVVVKGSPTSAGAKVAQIDFIIPNFCGTPKTALTMNAVNSNFPMQNLDYGVKRELTANVLNYEITNSSTVPVKITSIDLSNTSINDFVISMPTLPINLAVGAKSNFNVTFTPSKLGLIENDLVLTIEGNPNKPSGKLSGIGGKPEIAGANLDYGSIKVLVTSNKNLVITNTSTTMDLFIQKVEIETQSELNFAFGTGAKLTDITVPKNNGTVNIPIDFTPKTSGYKTAIVDIIHDAVSGPNVVFRTFKVDLTGSGIGLDMNPSMLNYGPVLTCGSGITKTVTFTNTSNETWTINNITINGTGKAGYTANFVNKTVAAKGTGTINVTFTPTNPIIYNATADISIDAGSGGTLNGSVTLTGTGIEGQAQANFVDNDGTIDNNLYAQPTKEFNLQFNMNVPSSVTNFDQVEFDINYYSKMFEYIPNSVSVSGISGWTWTVDKTTAGVFKVNGKGTATAPTNLVLNGSIKLSPFLSDVNEYKLLVKPVFFGNNVCIKGETDTINVKMNVCFTKGTMVMAGTSHYSLHNVEPNPVSYSAKIKFDIALKDNAKLELFNSMGELVAVLANEVLENGQYEVNLDTKDLNNGVYILRLTSAFYTETKSLIISK